MPVIKLETFIRAPVERVFDLARSVDVHTAAAAETIERAVAGVTSGLMELNDEVTWEGTHFGIRQRLTSRITALERPRCLLTRCSAALSKACATCISSKPEMAAR